MVKLRKHMGPVARIIHQDHQCDRQPAQHIHRQHTLRLHHYPLRCRMLQNNTRCHDSHHPRLPSPALPLQRNIFTISGVYCGRGVPRRTHIELHRTRGATMFEDSLVESAALLRSHNRWPAVVSITAQLCAAALILTIPLLHPEVLPMPHILPATLLPPRAPVPPPPPIHLEARPAAAATNAPAAPLALQITPLRDLIRPTGP